MTPHKYYIEEDITILIAALDAIIVVIAEAKPGPIAAKA